MDIKEKQREIRRAVDTGNVLFGSRQGENRVKHGQGKLLILTRNTPRYAAERLQHVAGMAEIPVYTYEGSGLELGEICGKPFVISTLLVLDAGKSKVLDITKKKPKQKRGA